MSASADGRVTLVLVTADGTQRTLPLNRAMGGYALSPIDGGIVVDDGVQLRELRLDGSSRNLGTFPGAPASPAFAISPDSTQVAWSTSTFANSVADNRLYVAPIGGSPRLLAERNSDPRQPAPPDAPQFWSYRVLRWTPEGILIVRIPNGIGGYGPFLDEGYDGYTALVDPATGQATALTNDLSAPLSTYADGGTWVFFAHAPIGYPLVHATAIDIARFGDTTHRYSLSGNSYAGDAVVSPDGRSVAYATLDSHTWNAASGAGHTVNFEAYTALRVIDVATGAARGIGPGGIVPLAWAADGRIIGRWVQDKNNFDGETLVSIDPVTERVRTLLTSPSVQSTVVAIPGAA